MSAWPAPAGSQSSLDADLLSRINGGRSPDLVRHSGLAAVARSRAQSMASKGSLQHSGASSGIANAAPDPSESNGAPDDGYTGTWCENLAFASSGSNVGATIYNGWRNSPSHNSCMNDTRMNSAGVGTYTDGDPCPRANSGGCVWAVLDLSRDSTPPGSSVAVKPSTPKPAPTRAPQTESPSVRADTNHAAANDDPRATPTPEPKTSPTPSSTPEPEEEPERGEVEVLANSADNGRPDIQATFGAREYAAIAVLLLFALFVLFLARRRI